MMNYKTFLNETYQHVKIASGILPISKANGRMLLALRCDEVPDPNTWACWGGAVNDNESTEVAAIREFKEESGYNGNIEMIRTYVYISHELQYHNYIGLIDKEFKPILNWENDDYKWVNINGLLEIYPKHFGLQELIDNRLEEIKKYSK